jgi:hypothetical protein
MLLTIINEILDFNTAVYYSLPPTKKTFKNIVITQEWWHRPVIPALVRIRQEE